MAETYHILDYRALPATLLATLVAGLRENSRVRSGKLRTSTALLAAAVDRLSYRLWMKTKDGQHNRKRPKSVLEALTKEPVTKTAAYETADEYERAWEYITGGNHGH